MTMSCADATIALGVYVVGALDPRERADVEAHLGHCPMCRDELAQLAPLPGLMSRLSVDEVLSDPPPFDPAVDGGAMLERLLAAASRDRKVATHRRWLAVAAAVAVLAGGTTAGVAVHRSMTATHWQQVSAAQGPVHMTVDMQPGATGTALHLWLRGVPSGERCRLVAIADDGSRDFAGSWEATYSGTATIRGITSIDRAHLSRLAIETYDGDTLVSAAVPRST